MDERIEQFERLWVNRARLPRLTTFADEPTPVPFIPRQTHVRFADPEPTGIASLDMEDIPSPPTFPLIRSTNDPFPDFDLGPIPVLEPFVRQDNRHHLLSPNSLKEWWKGDPLDRALIMREEGLG